MPWIREHIYGHNLMDCIVGTLPILIRAYWILATSSVLITLTPSCWHVPLAFKDAVRLAAARGKLWSSKPRGLGKIAELSVPQSWFGHFYALGTAMNGIVLTAVTNQLRSQQQLLVILVLLQLHLVRRLLETYFVMIYPPGAKMHLIAYVFGLSYYTVVPLSLLPHRDFPALLSGLMHTPEPIGPSSGVLNCTSKPLTEEAWISSPSSCLMLVAGAAVFLLGNAVQCWSHVALARLSREAALKPPSLEERRGALAPHPARSRADDATRSVISGDGSGPEPSGPEPSGPEPEPDRTSQRSKGSRTVSQAVRRRRTGRDASSAAADDGEPCPSRAPLTEPGMPSRGYLIPRGGLFEVVSCPHYLGEIVVYLGLVILTGGAQVNAWLMLAWVVINLVLAAGATHAWYLAEFPGSYPKDRRALFPWAF